MKSLFDNAVATCDEIVDTPETTSTVDIPETTSVNQIIGLLLLSY